jgi:hypothetical protein
MGMGGCPLPQTTGLCFLGKHFAAQCPSPAHTYKEGFHEEQTLPMDYHMTRNVEKVLPITWDKWDEAGGFGEIQFYNVQFTQDFGPFKKDDFVDCLFVSQLQGVVREYASDGDILRETNIKYVAGGNY